MEDNEAGGVADAADVRAGDVAIGLTASGRTPYVAAALRASRAHGAHTVLISAHPGAPMVDVDVQVAVATGAEVIAGSTRMKAGARRSCC